MVVMSFTEGDEREEKSQGIDGSWRRLRALFEHGRLSAPIKLTDKQTDETTLMCYSSGELYLPHPAFDLSLTLEVLQERPV